MKRFVVILTTLWLGCEPTGLGDHEPGAACTLNLECMGGVCTPERIGGRATGWAGGMCTDFCDGDCGDPTFACVTLGAQGVCLPRCTSDESCRSGYVCSAAAGVCLPDCRRGFSCGASLCDLATGRCLVDSVVVVESPDDDVAPGASVSDSTDASTVDVGADATSDRDAALPPPPVPCGHGESCPPGSACRPTPPPPGAPPGAPPRFVCLPPCPPGAPCPPPAP